MEKFLKSYSKVVPLIIFALYAIAYTFFKFYYREFGISIEQYISLSDFIFFSISILLDLLKILFILDIIIYLLYKEVTINFVLKPIIKKKLLRSKPDKVYLRFIRMTHSKEIFLIFHSITTLIIIFLVLLSMEKMPEGSDLRFLALPIVAIKFFWIINPEIKSVNENHLIFPSFLFIVFMFFSLSRIALYEAKFVKEGKSTRNITIQTNEKREIGTYHRDFSFIGETSNYIFFYNNSTGESLAFNKGDISLIKTRSLYHKSK
ncbi:hypothetical protein SAMN00777080_1834 [Aquiflexum balticum DSM 16537]|uniref:Uncharacterized protein n=1 Tax=Aquiflexum balticum DSM 16537 TaxID=758820 RepID=A0A1W2H311_9BACT|nr:hypothetical protein [Aquiflexum balticum]SMD43249.1 hypothetical protein SAMN00777080_1834 [Aquiflexum balticum DSM 16537]